MPYTLRALTPQDQPIVWTMLMYAAHESSLESVQTQPTLTRYALDWGRSGDLGVVAELAEQAIGAAWLRLWSVDRGFGYIEDAIPELAMAVAPNYRGQGIGTQLLDQLLTSAQTFYPAVSLSVRASNPALSLYQRTEFLKVTGSEVVNRTGGVSFTMLYRFSELGHPL
jgi:ribosomal protein S18 acetylase RimI-like enzyme